MTRDSLSVTDNRTGKTYEIPIEHGAIRAVDLRQIRTGPDDFGLLSYDPAFNVIPSVFDRRVVEAVADGVAQAAARTGVARRGRRRLVPTAGPEV